MAKQRGRGRRPEDMAHTIKETLPTIPMSAVGAAVPTSAGNIYGGGALGGPSAPERGKRLGRGRGRGRGKGQGGGTGEGAFGGGQGVGRAPRAPRAPRPAATPAVPAVSMIREGDIIRPDVDISAVKGGGGRRRRGGRQKGGGGGGGLGYRRYGG